MNLLPHKMTILLERNEQIYKEIHCPMHPLLQRKSKSLGLPSPDDRNSRMSFQQDCHRFGY